MKSQIILLADDEPDVLKLAGTPLSQAGFGVLTASDGDTALSLIRERSPALAILDLMMPGMSGLEVCRALKNDPATAALPLVILTAKASAIDRIVAFEIGVDDYITKPFSPRELVLRVKAILRALASAQVSSGPLRAGDICLDRDRHSVTVKGREVDLTMVEFKLLAAMLEARGRLQTRDALLSRVWGVECDIELRTVDTHLRRLREKLGASGDQIQTVRGFGYRLDGN